MICNLVSLLIIFSISGFEFDAIIVILILDVPIILSILYIFPKQMELTKDRANNRFDLKEVNYFCCSNLEIHLNLDNILFYWFDGILEEEHNIKSIKGLFLINTLKNLPELNFDLNTIKNLPKIFLIRFFEDSMIRENDGYSLEKKLNSFFGVPYNINNPLLFNIDKYMFKNNIKNDNDFVLRRIKVPQIMKFSDYFFTFFLENYVNNSKPKRLDVFFSNNFDTILIREDSDIYEFKMNTIEKFAFRFNNKYSVYYLRVIFKDNYEKKEEIIHYFYFSKENLKGLIYLLNEKIFNVNTDNLEQFFEE